MLSFYENRVCFIGKTGMTSSGPELHVTVVTGHFVSSNQMSLCFPPVCPMQPMYNKHGHNTLVYTFTHIITAFI